MTSLNNYSDEDLVSLLQKGNKAAYDEIYNRFWEKLFNYVFHRTQSKDVAFEITQDIFVSLWTRKDLIQLQSSLSGYLFAAVRFQIINHVKKSKLKQYYLDDYVRFISAADNSNEESMLAQDLKHALERCIAELPERCQEITRLSLLENWTNDRIAEKLNISHRTVENQLTLAKKHLRTALGDFMILYFLISRIL